LAELLWLLAVVRSREASEARKGVEAMMTSDEDGFHLTALEERLKNRIVTRLKQLPWTMALCAHKIRDYYQWVTPKFKGKAFWGTRAF
jgi:hypothetical protein